MTGWDVQVAARSGGIFFPLSKALCLACGSDPANGTQSKMGELMWRLPGCPAWQRQDA